LRELESGLRTGLERKDEHALELSTLRRKVDNDRRRLEELTGSGSDIAIVFAKDSWHFLKRAQTTTEVESKATRYKIKVSDLNSGDNNDDVFHGTENTPILELPDLKVEVTRQAAGTNPEGNFVDKVTLKVIQKTRLRPLHAMIQLVSFHRDNNQEEVTRLQAELKEDERTLEYLVRAQRVLEQDHNSLDKKLAVATQRYETCQAVLDFINKRWTCKTFSLMRQFYKEEGGKETLGFPELHKFQKLMSDADLFPKSASQEVMVNLKITNIDVDELRLDERALERLAAAVQCGVSLGLSIDQAFVTPARHRLDVANRAATFKFVATMEMPEDADTAKINVAEQVEAKAEAAGFGNKIAQVASSSSKSPLASPAETRPADAQGLRLGGSSSSSTTWCGRFCSRERPEAPCAPPCASPAISTSPEPERRTPNVSVEEMKTTGFEPVADCFAISV